MTQLRKVVGQAALTYYIRSHFFQQSSSWPKPSLMALAGTLLMLGAGFMIYAAHLHFRDVYNLDTAWLLTGLCVVLFSIILAAISVTIVMVKRYKMNQFMEDVEEAITEFAETADEELAAHIRQNPKTAVLAASIIGYVLTDRFL